MKEFKGTPGPWRRPKGSISLFIDAPIGGGMLQEVAACGPTDNPEHQTQNANLIWASIDLLDALQQSTQSMLDSGYSPDSAVIRANRAAIAKALGEDHE